MGYAMSEDPIEHARRLADAYEMPPEWRKVTADVNDATTLRRAATVLERRRPPRTWLYAVVCRFLRDVARRIERGAPL